MLNCVEFRGFGGKLSKPLTITSLPRTPNKLTKCNFFQEHKPISNSLIYFCCRSKEKFCWWYFDPTQRLARMLALLKLAMNVGQQYPGWQRTETVCRRETTWHWCRRRRFYYLFSCDSLSFPRPKLSRMFCCYRKWDRKWRHYFSTQKVTLLRGDNSLLIVSIGLHYCCYHISTCICLSKKNT